MAERKTTKNAANVDDFIKRVENETRRKDSQAVVKLMKAAARKPPQMWGPSIVGFGTHRYSLANGREAEICKIGFSPRKQSLVFYLGNFDGRAALLRKLGKHKMSRGGCLYINKLDDVDVTVLDTLIGQAWRA
ncbi:MAG: DUF1801 domain-containing protein [Gammaproteobacteria bacterium]|nr:DUF1801 domain-containing protein [Gammaproteobacteria bacterium]